MAVTTRAALLKGGPYDIDLIEKKLVCGGDDEVIVKKPSDGHLRVG